MGLFRINVMCSSVIEVLEIQMMNGGRDDEVYLYLSCVIGIVMECVILLIVRVHQ